MSRPAAWTDLISCAMTKYKNRHFYRVSPTTSCLFIRFDDVQFVPPVTKTQIQPVRLSLCQITTDDADDFSRLIITHLQKVILMYAV